MTHALLDYLKQKELQNNELVFPECLLHFNHKNVTRVEHTTSGSIRIISKPVFVGHNIVFEITVEEMGQELWQLREKRGPFKFEELEFDSTNLVMKKEQEVWSDTVY